MSWGLLGASWGVLGRSWGGLGGVLGALGGQDANMVRGIGFGGPILGPKMAPLGASLGHLALQDGAKVDKKSIPKSIKKTMPLGIDFLNDFGRSWGAKWDQVGIKIDPKSMLTSKSAVFKKTLFFFGKNQHFDELRGPSWEQKSIKHRS